jgi:glycosyltransferase involved in cell wall biosynthesis
MNPKVGILLNSYNGEKFIIEQLQSVFSQTYQNFDLLIYDDCSTDNTVKLAKKVVGNDPRVKFYQNKKNLGLLESFRRGMKMVSGDYICLCDNDNYWLSTRLEKEVQFLNDHPDCLMVCHDSFVSDQNLHVYCQSFTKSLNGKFWSISSFNVNDFSLENLLENNQVTGISMMFRSALQPSVALLPDGDMHDSWTAKLTASQSYIGYINEPLIIYRQHQHNYIGTETISNKFYFSAIFQTKWQKIFVDRSLKKISSLNLLLTLIPKNKTNIKLISRKIRFSKLMINLCQSNILSIFPNFFRGIFFSINENYTPGIKYFCFFLINRGLTVLLGL